jgi:hypothetical protein
MREAARDKRRRSGEQEEDSQTVSQPVDSSHPLSLFCVKKSAGQGRTNLGVGGRSVVVRLGVLWRSLDGLLIGLDGANKVTLLEECVSLLSSGFGLGGIDVGGNVGILLLLLGLVMSYGRWMGQRRNEEVRQFGRYTRERSV